jgi:uncharacterized repeat protein (TIGR01451 family)
MSPFPKVITLSSRPDVPLGSGALHRHRSGKRRGNSSFSKALVGALAVLVEGILASMLAAKAAAVITPAGAMLTAENCVATNGVIDPGEAVTLDFSLQNTGSSNTTNLVATLLPTNGVASPSGAQAYGVLTAGGAAVARPFTFTAGGPCGSTIAATFQLQDGTTQLGTVAFNFQLGPTVVIFSESFDSVTPTNLPPGWTATNATGTNPGWSTTTAARDTLPNAAFAPDPTSASDTRLVSPSIPISSQAAQLTFRHSYNTENSFDGGRLEISIGAGAFTNVTAAGGAFATNGYNGTILFGSVPAWTGISGGFITTKVNLPASAAGQNVRFRWRFTSDSSGSAVGWYVDTVSVSEVQCCANTNSADLSLSITDSPDPVLVGNNLTYALTTTNRGPATGTGVMLTNTLPPGVNYVSATSSQGSCTNLSGVVVCNLGMLASGAQATNTIIIKPIVQGTITNVASVTGSQSDFNPLNNTATALTTAKLPALTITDTTVTEGNSGTANATFLVSLSPASSQTVSVDFATADASAEAPADYVSTNRTLVFTPGQMSKNVVVAVRGDTLSEADEIFVVNLFNPTNAMLANSQGACTIIDNDPLPTLSINNVSLVEGNSGTTNAVFTITLSPVSGQLVTVDLETTNGTAIAVTDYVATEGTVVFDPGQTNQTFEVPVLGDTLNEANETLLVNLINPVNATIAGDEGVGTIVNDDLLPTIVPAGTTLAAESCSPTNGAIDPGETVTVNFSVKNISTGTARTTNLMATLLATGGVVSPSGPTNYGALNAGATASRPFTFTATGACGGRVSAVFQLQDGPNPLGNVTNQLLLGKPITVFAENFDAVTESNLPAGWTASLTGAGAVWATTTALGDTLPNSAFAPDPDGTSDNRLASPPISINTPSAQLTFRHNYSAEQFLDGGVLEISIGTGPFTDIVIAGGSFVSGGYNSTINGGTKSAWSGISDGFVTTEVNLPASAAGTTIRLRWRFLSDTSVGAIGWYVDSVSINDGIVCCGGAGVPPSLAIAIAGSNVLISWPASATGYSLQSTTNLAPSAWGAVTNVPVQVLDQYHVTNDLFGTSRFYRLIR